VVNRPVLKLEARTKEGQILVSRDIELGRRNSVQGEGLENGNVDGYALSAVSPLPTLLAFETPASLSRHLIDHLAVANTNEQNTIQHVLIPGGDADQMRQYLTGFWLERSQNEKEALALHRDYMARIEHVDEQYGDCKKGQGSLTEMGNIYLRFGMPNTIVKRHHETDYYPYEIWHYHKAGRFNNKRFLFYAPHVVGECFELLHSDMLGERQNEDWLLQLRSRENTIRVSQSMENRLNPRDTFSREEPEDLFFNPR
jgi:GWxTD domain-containing protein